jgi:O-antigen/teichoic acid export membrane protein
MRLDQIMLGNLVSDEAVGNYSAAVRLSEVWYLFPNIICSSVFPSIIKARQEDVHAYHVKLQQLYTLMAWAGIAVSVAVTFVSGPLTALFYGAQYGRAAHILTIHIWTGVFVFLGIASGQYLIIENLGRIAFYRTLAGLLVNLILNFLLIPLYRETGAAVATLLSQACAAYLFDAFNRSTRQMFLMKTKSFFPFLPINHAKS